MSCEEGKDVRGLGLGLSEGVGVSCAVPPSEYDAAAYKTMLMGFERVNHSRVFGCALVSDFLIATTNTGHVLIFNIATWLTRAGTLAASDTPPSPDFRWEAHPGPVFSLTVTDDGNTLVTGGDTEMRGWAWRKVVAGDTPQSAQLFELRNPPPPGARSVVELSETNGLAWDAHRKRLLSAAGDGRAYEWDLASGSRTPTAVFAGHEDYLHSVVALDAVGGVATGSEDGTAKLWDARSGRCEATFQPCGGGKGDTSKPGSTSRAGTGTGGGVGGSAADSRWVGAVAADAGHNWLAAGCGDGSICVYHVGSRILTSHMTGKGSVLGLSFNDGQIVSVGMSPVVEYWSIAGGTPVRPVPTDIPACYAVCVGNDRSTKCTVVGGSSALMDVYLDGGGKSFSLSVAPR